MKKDDRPDRNDPSRYVMGWNNEKKKEVLHKKRKRLVDIIQQSEEIIKRARTKKSACRINFYAGERIKSHERICNNRYRRYSTQHS